MYVCVFVCQHKMITVSFTFPIIYRPRETKICTTLMSRKKWNISVFYQVRKLSNK